MPEISRVAGGVAAILLSLPTTLLGTVGATASAQPCPDIAVAFARGTSEPPGVGGVGTAFVDALRAQAAPRTVGSHGVIYPASSDFAGGPAFTTNIVDGVRDGNGHVQGVLAACPNAQVVLAGFSQGAVVASLITTGVVPAGVVPETVPPPLPPVVADHVAAVVLFGKPAGPSLVKYGVPDAPIGAPFLGKSLELCAAGDPVCSEVPVVGPDAHGAYAVNGMVGSAAAFAVSRLQAPLPPPI